MFRRGRDPKGSTDYLALMMGRHQGLMLARPDITISHHTRDRDCGRLIDQTRRFGPKKVTKAAVPSLITFLDIIRGLLTFTGLDKIITFCKDVSAFGQGSYECKESLLSRCPVEAD